MKHIALFLFVAVTASACSERRESRAAQNLPSEAVSEVGARQMNSVYKRVAKDAEDQYGIASRQRDQVQICVQAAFVSAAHLQAKDEEKYRRWKAIEKRDCAAAGVVEN